MLHKCIWELTRACNLRCLHCENRSGPRSPLELGEERLLAVAQELIELQCGGVALTGGEPLLRPVWKTLARRLSQAGVEVALVTNGLLLDTGALDDCEACGVSALGISLDGLQPTHDGIRQRAASGSSPFDLAVAALERAAPRVSTVAITQVNQRNLGELPAIGRLLTSLGVLRWQIQLAVPLGRLQDMREPFVLVPAQLEELVGFLTSAILDPQLPQLDISDTIGYCTGEDALFRGTRHAGGGVTPGMWLGCSAGLRTLAITYDGKVRGCSALPPELDAGDLHRESLRTIWEDRSRFDFTLGFTPDRLSGGCAGCDLGNLCRGGCTTMAFWTTGTLGHNPYCLRAVRRAASPTQGAHHES